MNPTLAHLRLDRLTVIRMLGSNAPQVLPPDHGQHDSTSISYEEQQARARSLRQNETMILGLAIEGVPQGLIGALFGVGQQTVQKRLAEYGVTSLPWGEHRAVRRENMLRARRVGMAKREATA